MSKVWQGYYLYFGQQQPIRFTNLIISEGPVGTVTGSGIDKDGEFTIEGTVSNGVIQFSKNYKGTRQIFYSGTIKGDKIHGKWGLSKGNSHDEFKLQRE